MENKADQNAEIQQKFSETLSRLASSDVSNAIQELIKKNPDLCKKIRDHVTAKMAIKIIQDLFPKGITALEMARILKDLGYNVLEISEAIRDGYPGTTAKDMVAILKDPEVYPETTRDEMIDALYAAQYNICDTMNAVTPVYPEMVLIECKSGCTSTLKAEPSADPNATVFFFQPVDSFNCREYAGLSGQPHKCQTSEVQTMLKPGRMCIDNNYKDIGFIRYQLWRNDMYYQKDRYPDAKSLMIQVKCLLCYAIGREFHDCEDLGDVFCKS